MLPLMQKPSFRLLTWKADTGGWWDTCGWRGGSCDSPSSRQARSPTTSLPVPGAGARAVPISQPQRPAKPGLSPGARGGAECNPRIPPGKWDALSPLPKETLSAVTAKMVPARPGRIPAGSSEARALPVVEGGATQKHAWGSDAPCPLPGPRPLQNPAASPGWPGPCLLSYVEGVAVVLGVEPAAAEGLPQNGVVGLLDPLQAVNKEACVRSCGWGTDASWDGVWTEGQQEGLPAAHSPGHL